MREFFTSVKSVIILSLIFVIAIVGFNFYDIACDKTNSVSYTKSEIEDMDLELVNINRASKDELLRISYISEDVAQNIVDYREENGDFETIEEIQNVNGIGKKIFYNIRSMITVN